MAIDIYHSRRDKFKKCLLYDKCDDNNLDVYVLNTKPIALFYAREVTNRTQQGDDIQGVFSINRNLTTLETTDHIDVEKDNIILYMGHAWVVDSVNKQIHLKESEFSNENHYITQISVRR